MNWVIGIGIALLCMVVLAMEIATDADKGRGSYFLQFKKSFLFVVPLFLVGGIIFLY
ncbi:hypothetical protein [Bacillus sp. JCM 19034]|uniref:hypothetical protein n=1 Tax=Bacillus sp. JCM 19034 TaxID=1481928 RepID=UPI000ABA0DE7|nr:hypothetical protein [Bacillus sp. JCM 19034]